MKRLAQWAPGYYLIEFINRINNPYWIFLVIKKILWGVINLTKIQGVKDLLKYLESAGCPMTEEQINEGIAKRQIPHSQSYANTIFFDLRHIDWWISEQQKQESKNWIRSSENRYPGFGSPRVRIRGFPYFFMRLNSKKECTTHPFHGVW